eukprot:Rhum_TRINITY_DN25771_c0_g1::Rhum_TRINITY_DN25771_c0_g1_i1::g.182740::m.182740
MLRSCSHAARAVHTASPLSRARRHAGRIEELLRSKKNRESVSQGKGAKKASATTGSDGLLLPADARLEGKQTCPPVIGHVENIYIDPEPITLRNNKGTFQLWRHLYTVSGTTAVKYISKEWMRDRIEPGIDIGRIVCMTCVSDSSGNLSLKGIRPASPKEMKVVTETEAVRANAEKEKTKEMELRQRVVLSVINSAVSVNLDKDLYQKVVQDVYKFVKASSA